MLITYYDYSNSIWSNTTLAAKVRHGHFKRLEIGPSFQLRFKNFQVQTSKRAFLKLRLGCTFQILWRDENGTGIKITGFEHLKFEKCATRACPWPKMIETPLGNSIWINFHVQILRFLRVISSRILWAKKPLHFKIIWIFRARKFRVSFEFCAKSNHSK